MHILITADTVGGVWVYTQELVSGLLARFHKITLVSFGGLPDSEDTERLNRLPGLTYIATMYPLEWMANCQAGIQASRQFLHNVITTSKPDVLHLNQYCYGSLDLETPRVVVGHSDVFSWWNAVHDSDPPVSEWSNWYYDIVNQGLCCADVVVTPSNWMMKELVSHYDWRAPERVIYNGRTATLFDPNKPKSSWALSVGRIWDSGKHTSLLFDCRLPLPVRVVGANAAPESDSSHISTTRQKENLEFYDRCHESKLRSFYAESAAYIATSCYEPFGLAPVEAAFSGCAIVANDIPVFRELWPDAAMFFDRNDGPALERTLQRLCDSSELRQEYATRAYEHAREHFDAQRMVAEYEQLYKQLMSRGHAA